MLCQTLRVAASSSSLSATSSNAVVIRVWGHKRECSVGDGAGGDEAAAAEDGDADAGGMEMACGDVATVDIVMSERSEELSESVYKASNSCAIAPMVILTNLS
jgi:hypothetical protein